MINMGYIHPGNRIIPDKSLRNVIRPDYAWIEVRKPDPGVSIVSVASLPVARPGSASPLWAACSGRCTSIALSGRKCRRLASIGLVAANGDVATYCLIHLRRGLREIDLGAGYGNAVVIPSGLLPVIRSAPSLVRRELALMMGQFLTARPPRHPFVAGSLEETCLICGRGLSEHLRAAVLA